MGRREWGIGTKKYILMIMNECTQIHMYLHVFTSVFTSVFMPRQTIKTLENFLRPQGVGSLGRVKGHFERENGVDFS